MPVPERFEDLPPELRARLREAGDPTDARWSFLRGLRSFSTGCAAFALLFLPGGWLVSAFAAPAAMIQGVIVLRRTWGWPKHERGRRWAWGGVAASFIVLLLVGLHLWVMRTAFDALAPLFGR